jgi:hypothetical protein
VGKKVLLITFFICLPFVMFSQELNVVSAVDREVTFSWQVGVGSHTFTLYVSTAVFLSTANYQVAEYCVVIETYSVEVSTYYYKFSFPIEFNGHYPYFYTSAVLTTQTTSYFYISSAVVVEMSVDVIYQDVDGDGNLEMASNRDDNLANGYESYRDLELNSQVYCRVDWDADGVFEYLIDTDLDNKPELLWIPHTQQIYRLLRRNVDRDSAAEYEISGTARYYDVSDMKFHTFCRFKGRVTSSKNEPLSFAQISLKWEKTGEELLSFGTDDQGNFDVYITTLAVESYLECEVKSKGFLTQRRSLWFDHDKEYTGNFVLYPVVTSESSFTFFPNPVKEGGVLRVVFDIDKSQKIRVLLLDEVGSLVSTLLDGDLAAGQQEFYFYVKWSAGYYYIVGEIGGKKFKKMLRIVK